MSNNVQRDYSILGPEREKAMEKGLVAAEWYRCEVPRKRLKELMSRRDGPAARDTLLWIVLLGALGYLVYLTWGTWWVIPALAVYGVVYSTPAVSNWHEFSHGTPFRTAWLNEAMYQICACLILVQATNYRWTHTRHHTDTIIVGSDPEIMEPRPPKWRRLMRWIFRETTLIPTVKSLTNHALGRLNDVEIELIPPTQYKKLFWEARVFILFYSGIIALCFYLGSILPIVLVGLPIYYGFYLNGFLIAAQHLGMYEDKLDHRLCVRTFYTNPLLRFLYTNMNYHLEHHMFPMVPYYNLPALHEEIKYDCPAPAPSFLAAVKETLTALKHAQKDPSHVVPKYREFAEKTAKAERNLVSSLD